MSIPTCVASRDKMCQNYMGLMTNIIASKLASACNGWIAKSNLGSVQFAIANLTKSLAQGCFFYAALEVRMTRRRSLSLDTDSEDGHVKLGVLLIEMFTRQMSVKELLKLFCSQFSQDYLVI